MAKFASKRKEFLDALEKAMSVTGACKKIGIASKTYYEWRDKYPDFELEARACLIVSRNTKNEIVEAKLMEKLMEGDTKCIIFYLSRVHPEFNNSKAIKEYIKQMSPIKRELTKDQKDSIAHAVEMLHLRNSCKNCDCGSCLEKHRH